MQSDTGLTGIAGGWYWAAALTAGLLVTAVWYHPAGRTGPGWASLVIALLLTVTVTVVPLLAAPRASLPGWLWLSSEWSRGTFALLVTALALGGLARHARSRPRRLCASHESPGSVVSSGPADRPVRRGYVPVAALRLGTLLAAGCGSWADE